MVMAGQLGVLILVLVLVGRGPRRYRMLDVCIYKRCNCSAVARQARTANALGSLGGGGLPTPEPPNHVPRNPRTTSPGRLCRDRRKKDEKENPDIVQTESGPELVSRRLNNNNN